MLFMPPIVYLLCKADNTGNGTGDEYHVQSDLISFRNISEQRESLILSERGNHAMESDCLSFLLSAFGQ